MEPVVLVFVRRLAKRAEQFVLPALFFAPFFWAGKRKEDTRFIE